MDSANVFSKILRPGLLTLKDLRRAYHQAVRLRLDSKAIKAITKSNDTVRAAIAGHKPVYGVNTGFGSLATTAIPEHQLNELQRKLILSHAAGVGEYLSDSIVKLILVLKINSLAQGYSGIQLPIIKALITLLNEELYPCVPAKGSVGASGDLAPLAHLALPLLGMGEIRYQGKLLSAKKGLKKIGMAAVELGPKDGLALLNGTQVSTALALAALFRTENLLTSAMVFGSLSVEAAAASHIPFDKRIHRIRGQRGQEKVAAVHRKLLAGSGILKSHQDCGRVQDPYSLRCQPQVMGACLDHVVYAAQQLLIEVNGVSDNPLVFSDSGDILSGGNFHAEPVAMVADMMAVAIAEIGALSERRIALLIDTHQSKLPPFLVENGGVNSGFMMPQVTAAALASENKSLAHPASVDSLPTSVNQEDHVSMATFAARRLLEMVENTETIIAVEGLAACQGVELRAPLQTSKKLRQVVRLIRKEVAPYREDRYFAPDIEKVKSMIRNGVFNVFVENKSGEKILPSS